MNNDINIQAKKLAIEVIYEMNKQKKDKRFHNTKLLMKNYSKLKKHIDTISTEGFRDYFVEEIQDLVDSEGLFLSSVLRTKVRTAQMLSCIDIALSALEEEYMKDNKSDTYKAFYMYYVENKTYVNIACELHATKSTVQRWVTEVLKKLNVLLWGVDSLGV